MIERISDLAQMFSDIESSVTDEAGLTSRELEVLELIGKGLPNQQIAKQLVIEVGIVKNRIHSILEKLNVSSRGEAVAYLAFIKKTAQFSQNQTPENYVGTGRQQYFSSPENIAAGKASTYTIPDNLPLHHFAVSGSWDFKSEYAKVNEAGTKLELHFYAKDVYLVMDSTHNYDYFSLNRVQYKGSNKQMQTTEKPIVVYSQRVSTRRPIRVTNCFSCSGCVRAGYPQMRPILLDTVRNSTSGV